MLKSKLLILVAAACVTGVCSAGNATPEGISGSGSAGTAKPACLILAPFLPFCFI